VTLGKAATDGVPIPPSRLFAYWKCMPQYALQIAFLKHWDIDPLFGMPRLRIKNL
jgi:hypothetical protein